MNILLANLYWNYGPDASLEKMKHLHYPTGLAIIAGEIKRKRKDALFAIDTYLWDMTDEKVFEYIDVNKIDCVLLSMYLGNYQYRYLKEFINGILRRFPNVIVVVGGPLASTVAGTLLDNVIPVDNRVICVIGEGEQTIIDLLDCVENKSSLGRVRGICYREGKPVFTLHRERIRNLDSYCRPDYSIFDTLKYVEYVKRTNRCWEISASRGCFGGCIFCKLVFGRQITMRSADSIVKEMEDFYNVYGINQFNFVDDNFLNSEKQVWSFYNALKRSNKVFKWRFQGRADLFHPDLAKALSEVGLYDVSFGIESGSGVILSEMNKLIDLEKARNNLKALRDVIDTHGNFIIGMPSESQETIDSTIEFIHDVGLKHVNAGILTLFPGTKLYESVRNNKIINNEDHYCDNLGPVYVAPYINLTSFPNEKLLSWVTDINSALAGKG